MRLHLAGSYWSYREPRRIRCDGRPVDGRCVIDPRREILAHRGLPRQRRQETTLHKIAHTLDWDSSESWIEVWADATNNLLTLAGCGSFSAMVPSPKPWELRDCGLRHYTSPAAAYPGPQSIYNLGQ